MDVLILTRGLFCINLRCKIHNYTAFLVPRLDLEQQPSHPSLRNFPLPRYLTVECGAAELLIEDVLRLNTAFTLWLLACPWQEGSVCLSVCLQDAWQHQSLLLCSAHSLCRRQGADGRPNCPVKQAIRRPHFVSMLSMLCPEQGFAWPSALSVHIAGPSDVGIGNGLSSCVGATVVYRLLGLFLVTSEKQGRQSVPRPFVVVSLSLSSADVIRSLSNWLSVSL